MMKLHKLNLSEIAYLVIIRMFVYLQILFIYVIFTGCLDAELVAAGISVADTSIVVAFIGSISTVNIFVVSIAVMSIAVAAAGKRLEIFAGSIVGAVAKKYRLRLVGCSYDLARPSFGFSFNSLDSSLRLADHQQSFPSACSRPDVKRESFSSTPSCVCEYQNKACFYIL